MDRRTQPIVESGKKNLRRETRITAGDIKTMMYTISRINENL